MSSQLAPGATTAATTTAPVLPGNFSLRYSSDGVTGYRFKSFFVAQEILFDFSRSAALADVRSDCVVACNAAPTCQSFGVYTDPSIPGGVFTCRGFNVTASPTGTVLISESWVKL